MARTESTMLPLITAAPDFALPDTDGNIVKLEEFAGARALVIIFFCNHCPFVKHVQHKIKEIADKYIDEEVAFVAINSNDTEKHPEDSPEKMKEEKATVGYPFPYLFDETQEVAKAYRAACTPDFFVFDMGQRLIYRGRMDGASPGNDVAITGEELTEAIDATIEARTLPADDSQKPSIGCNIKWKPGNEPDYFGAQ